MYEIATKVKWKDCGEWCYGHTTEMDPEFDMDTKMYRYVVAPDIDEGEWYSKDEDELTFVGYPTPPQGVLDEIERTKLSDKIMNNVDELLLLLINKAKKL